MFDIHMTRLHELTVVVYAFSVLLYFFDFIHHNRKANRIAFWLLAFVWVLQSAFLFLYMLETGRFPVLTIFEGYVFLCLGSGNTFIGNQSFTEGRFYCFFHKYTWIYRNGDSYLCSGPVSISILSLRSLYRNCF